MTTLINRQAFFKQLLGTDTSLAVASLAEHTAPLTKADVYHLLRRCCFSVDTLFAESLIGKSAREAVDTLLGNMDHLPIPQPGFDVNQGFPFPDQFGEVEKQIQRTKNLEAHFEQNHQLIEWWVDLMKADKKSLSEKLTFFWHGHFACQYDGGEPIPAQWMYRQNDLFRRLKLSDFKSFLEKIAIDGTMLLYLNGNQNSKGAPNENFARELFELFSIGIGDDHYSEEDIREAAKVLTGWRANHFIGQAQLYEPYLVPEFFSAVGKAVFDEPFTFEHEINQENAFKYSIQKLMETTLKQKGEQVSKFMAQKLYRYFVYSKPQTVTVPLIEELALEFKNSGFDVRTTLIKLLSSQHFFDPNTRGVQIKTPIESLIGFSSHFNIATAEFRELLINFGQEPLNPPNVSGWKGYRTWITANTLPSYIYLFNSIVNNESDENIGNWATAIEGFDDSAKLTESLAFLFLAKLPNESRLAKLEHVLLGAAPYYEWPALIENTENAGLRVKALLKEIFKMPDFYLA